MDLGAQLLRDAILNSLKVSELAGARALVVDPTGETASAFYRRFGFSGLPGTTRMVLRFILPHGPCCISIYLAELLELLALR